MKKFFSALLLITLLSSCGNDQSKEVSQDTSTDDQNKTTEVVEPKVPAETEPASPPSEPTPSDVAVEKSLPDESESGNFRTVDLPSEPESHPSTDPSDEGEALPL